LVDLVSAGHSASVGAVWSVPIGFVHRKFVRRRVN
jgi:hypothetical protein